MSAELAPIPFDSGANGGDFHVSMVSHAMATETSDELFGNVIDGIAGGRWAREVELVRSAFESSGRDAADPLKKKLPAVLFSGTFSRRAADALVQHSGLICVDLDHLNERLLSVRQAIESDPHTKVSFVSPSGTGLKVVFQCSPTQPHIRSFKAAERYVLETFGLEIDPACKDVSRLCFVSHDPETFVADTCEPLPDYEEPVKHVTAHESMPGAVLTAGIEPWDDYDMRCDMPAILTANGWTACGKHGWTRPGKTQGVSATWNKVPGRFFVFSSSTQFEANHVYRPWHVYAILNHGGDWKRAVAALRKEGYGAPPARAKPTPPANQSTNGLKVYDPGYEEPQGRGTDRSPTEDPGAKLKPFTLWAPSQFLAFVPDPSACLLGTGYLELGQWTSLIGIGGLGKTRLALWLVISQILNRLWCDIPTNGKPQKSVILSTENGLRRWKEDLTRILGTLTEAEQATVEAHVRILAMTDDEDGDLCLGNDENVTRLKLTLSGDAFGIVVFDPFADMVDGDENKTVDLVSTTTTLRSITRSCCPKAAVLIIHHGRTGAANVAQAGDQFNAGNFGRGAKALYSKVRCEIQLAPADRDNPDRLVLACGKANDTVKFTTRGLIFNPDDFTYTVDPSFDLDAWREDVAGKRKQSAVSVADVVKVVHGKCPLQGDETDTRAVFLELEGSGVSLRTIQGHIKAAVEGGYLRHGDRRGRIRLGAKPLPK